MSEINDTTPAPEVESTSELDATPIQFAPGTQISEQSKAVIVAHIPGAPLETEADRVANAAKALEPVAETRAYEHITEYRVGEVIASSPEANLASRSNIVSDGRY
jgi:hypothetical protein